MGESDILHAFNHPIFVEDLDEGFVLLIDPDTSGNLVELGVLDSSDGPVIIHAMSAQRKHLR